MDFNTRIQTNLNILYVGSSITHQFASALQVATMSTNNMETIRYSWGNFHRNTFSALTADNGTVSCLRVTGYFCSQRKDDVRRMAPNGGGGWLSYDIRELKRMVHTWRHVESIDTGYGPPTSPCEISLETNSAENITEKFYPCEEKDFDVVVHQPPVGNLCF